MKRSPIEYVPTGWEVAADFGRAKVWRHHDGQVQIVDGEDEDIKQAEEWCKLYLKSPKPIEYFRSKNKQPPPEQQVFAEIRKENAKKPDTRTLEQRVIDAAREIAKLRSPDIAGLLSSRGWELEGLLVSRLVLAVLEYEPDLIREIRGDPMEKGRRYKDMMNETADAVRRVKPREGPPNPLSAFGWVPPE